MRFLHILADIILNFKYKEKIIKIGVVHICGGGPDERIINSDSFDVIINDDDINNDDDYIKKKSEIMTKEDYIIFYKNVFPRMMQRIDEAEIEQNVDKLINDQNINIKTTVRKLIKLKKIKDETIKNMINEEVDIILCDFNSDFEYYLESINDKQVKFLNSNGFNYEQIKIWNEYLFKLLKKNNYNPICNENCLKFYKTQHTSIHEISPDVIYYKKTNVEINK